ncbi:hypothetical protein CBR_g40918 [Chara braunii]|uniref:CCHC-type domain-containing protein n=1 Tax=Chara braunii TaxID=69332 RepID=A0A388K2E2_CHABU|nr:hypothetical protein CBR_g40918 [Chara braunii]|eukprot:GBG64218.1 hypothetical protein CBR_g40918 [Chara braunii]
MAISYSMAAQKAMSEKEKHDFALRQGGTTTSKAGQTASQSGTVSRTSETKSQSLGQKAMDFLLEQTQIKAEIKITKEVIKGEGGKEEEVEVWEYPEEDIQSLNELYEKHAVLFNFSGRSRELPLNEKRRWVMDRLTAMEEVPGKEPEVSYHRRGRYAVMIVCVDPTYAQYLMSIGSLKCKGAVVTIQPWKPPRPPQAEASRHRQSMLRNHLWVQFDNLSEGMHSFVQRRLDEEFPSNPIIEWLPTNPDFLAPNHDARVACLEVKSGAPPKLPDQWIFKKSGQRITVFISTKTNPFCFKCRGRGHLGTSCPQGGSGGAEVKRVALRQFMLQECENKPGVWYINSSQYRGWIFDDNLENPRWVSVLKREPTLKRDIYPPYDSRWQHTGAKRMEDKETGYIVKSILDDAVMQDAEPRLKLMKELHEVGRNAELAFLENAEARAQQQEQIRGHEEGSKDLEEGKGDNMDYEDGGRSGTEGGSTSTKRKGDSRGEDGSNTQGESSQHGKSRQKAQSGEADTAREKEEEGGTSKEASGSWGKENETDTGSLGVASKGTRAEDEETGKAGGREVVSMEKDPSEGSSQHKEDRSGSQGSQELEDEDKVRERARRRGMLNVDNMTMEQILQAEEDQRESSGDTENEASSEEEEEEEEEEQDELDEKDWSREQWVKEVEQLEWGRLVECEIRLAHHKHLRNLQQVTQAGEDFTSENRFELLRREGEINEFCASQYTSKTRTIRNEIHEQQEEYGRNFQWPKTYHSKERKRDGKKRKAQTMEEQSVSAGLKNDSVEDTAMDEDRANGESEVEEVQDLRRQAAILVAQVILLKDENRELEEDTTNVQKIAKGQWKEIEAAARLEAKNGTRRRVVLPCRWNTTHSDWEVAINQSLQLLTAPMEECSGSDLQRLIGAKVPARAFILREGGEEPMTIGEEREEEATVDFGPILFQMGQSPH